MLLIYEKALLKATSAENVVYSFTYDSSGIPLTSKIGDDTNYINTSAEYTGSYLSKLTDALGKYTTYNWNEQKGILDSVTDPKGKFTSNSYDYIDRLQSVTKNVNGQDISNIYSYEPRTGKLLESTYGNGQKVSSDYDSLDRVTAKKYNGNTRYTYDSWGKLISTTGSLASTVGVKNPYRYRGYRYDTETGLYYLQSRYYNPEWGRFINADGIIGQTGELLGHNLFTYAKNNTANMSDPSGFRPVFDDEETQRDYNDWTWAQHKSKMSSSVAATNASKTSFTGKTLKRTLAEAVPGAASGTLYSMGEYLGEKAVFGSISAKLFGSTWTLPAHLGVFEYSFNQLGVIGLLMSINDNMQYGVGLGLARGAIDIAGFVATGALVTTFAASGGIAAVGIGLTVGIGVEVVKWAVTTGVNDFK